MVEERRGAKGEARGEGREARGERREKTRGGLAGVGAAFGEVVPEVLDHPAALEGAAEEFFEGDLEGAGLAVGLGEEGGEGGELGLDAGLGELEGAEAPGAVEAVAEVVVVEVIEGRG